jgi:hypothetical protein
MNYSLLSLVFLTFSFQVSALPHLDLEMDSSEYRTLLQEMQKQKLVAPTDDSVERALKLGDRLSKWIAHINQNRSAESAIRLTSASTRRGIPIDRPNIYNPEIIKAETDKVINEMPKQMRDIILGNGAYPTDISLDDETFIKHGRALDRNYQQAARYKSLVPYRFQYQGQQASDVRGYHYLVTNKLGVEELRDVSLIPADQLPKVKDALIRLCLNNGDGASSCQSTIDKATSDNKLADAYRKYFPAGKRTWDKFFVIPTSARRKDVTWKGQEMIVPFNTPSIPKFVPYLKDNIEDEFRFESWGMKLNFGSFSNGPLLVFKPGVVPHVNGLGGNQIVMDSNQPIEEYESQWTIRHEFGHVIGLPDCYHEFYDTRLNAFVNYQLDTTDLMCSRAGNMNERIFQELKKAYQK